MDTVLNIGLNDETAEGMVQRTGDTSFVYDSYRRWFKCWIFVLDLPDEAFEDVLEEYKEEKGVKSDTDLNAEDGKLDRRFPRNCSETQGFDFPEDPFEQLKLATEAVFKSWNGKRAIDYRNAAGIIHDLGTAVNIVTMVFGNMGWDSAQVWRLPRSANGENFVRRLPDECPG